MAEPAAKIAQKAGNARKPRKELPRPLRSIASTSIPTAMRRALPAGEGEPLPNVIAAQLGARYGQDFSAVRMHRDADAQRSAAAFGAKAYTLGTHIVFGEGRYAPGTDAGQRLIAHELAHVVQQSRGGATPELSAAAPHEQAARNAAVRATDTAASAGTVAVAGATGVGIARDEDDKKRVQQTPKQLPPGPPAPKQLPPGPVTVDQVMNDPNAVQQFNQVAAGSARNVKDITNVQGAIFEEVMNREIDRRIAQRSGLQELMPADVDVSKLRFVDPKTDPSKLQPGEAMFVRGDRIKGEVDGKPVKLTDGMILIGEKKGIRVVTVFEGKSGERRASDLHRTESGKEDPTSADLLEKAQVRKETPKKQKVIESELGGQVRKTIERLSPQEGDNATTIQIDGKSVAVRASAKRTRYLGVVPKDVDISASQEHLVKKEGVNFAPLKLASTEGDIKVAASKVAEKAQAGKPWPLPPAKKEEAGKSPADKQAAAAARQQAADARKAAAAQKAAARQQAIDARKAAAAQKAAAKQQAADARKAAAAQKAAAKQQAADARKAAAAQKAAAKPQPAAKKPAAVKPTAAPKTAPAPAPDQGTDQTAVAKPVPAKTTGAAAPDVADAAPAKATAAAKQTAAPGDSKPTAGDAPAPASTAAKPGVQATPSSKAGAAGKPPTGVKVAIPANPSAQAGATAPAQPAVKPGAAGARPAPPPQVKTSAPPAPNLAAGPKGGVRTTTTAQPRLPAGGGVPKGDIRAGAGAAAGSLIEAIAVPIINHYLQKHYAERYAEHARKKIAEALERDRPKFEEAIKRAHREIEEAQAQGKSVSLHITLDLDWQDTADRDPIVGTGISSGSILMNVTVLDIQVVHEGQKAKPYRPPQPEGFVENLADFAKFALKQNMGMSDTYEGVDLELEGTNAEAKRIREIDQALKTAAPDSEEAKKLNEERTKLNATYSEFLKQRQARKDAEAARAKAAEDKRNKERLDRVLAADKAKAATQQQAPTPLLPPPGGVTLPANQPIKSIGPFDISGEVTPRERGELIAARFEQKKEEWVAYAKKIEAKYNDGSLSDEARVRFRNARDAWIASLNNYATAMGQHPDMRSGAVRMKAIQDWLANDGHNALLIGL